MESGVKHGRIGCVKSDGPLVKHLVYTFSRSRLRSDDNSAGGSSKLLSAQSSNLPIDHMSTWKTTDSGCLTENSSVVSVVASNQRDDLLQASPEFPGKGEKIQGALSARGCGLG